MYHNLKSCPIFNPSKCYNSVCNTSRHSRNISQIWTHWKSKIRKEEDANHANSTEVLRILKRIDETQQELKSTQTNMETKLEKLAAKLDNHQSDTNTAFFFTFSPYVIHD